MINSVQAVMSPDIPVLFFAHLLRVNYDRMGRLGTSAKSTPFAYQALLKTVNRNCRHGLRIGTRLLGISSRKGDKTLVGKIAIGT